MTWHNGRYYRMHRGKYGSKGALHGKRRNTLKQILREYSDEVKEAAVEALNRNAEMLTEDIKQDMNLAGIQRRTGTLEASVKLKEATVKNLDARVKSEVYAPMPKEPGKRNKNIRYPAKGVPYGRLIEFSPRIGKPFFYTAFYIKKLWIVNDVFKACREAGKK